MYMNDIFIIFLICILISYIYLSCILYIYPEYIISYDNLNIIHPFSISVITSFFIYNQFD